jgi:hypothetical protein
MGRVWRPGDQPRWHQNRGIGRGPWHHRERSQVVDMNFEIADVAALAELLHETAGHHGSFEAVAPPHDWWDWYAAYMDARQRGSTPEAASEAAGRYMAEVKHIVV